MRDREEILEAFSNSTRLPMQQDTMNIFPWKKHFQEVRI